MQPLDNPMSALDSSRGGALVKPAKMKAKACDKVKRPSLSKALTAAMKGRKSDAAQKNRK